jgi:hypothetical protein
MQILIAQFVLCVHETLFLALREEYIVQGGTYPERQVSQVIEFCAVTPNICVSSVWNLFHVTLLVPTILRWLPNFWKICLSLIL